MSDAVTLGRDITRAKLVEELRQIGPALVRLGVTSMALFGSRARNDNRMDSDVDLIIDVEQGRKFSLLDLVAVEHEVEDHVGLPVNIFMRRSLEADFLDSAKGEEMVIFRA